MTDPINRVNLTRAQGSLENEVIYLDDGFDSTDGDSPHILGNQQEIASSEASLGARNQALAGVNFVSTSATSSNRRFSPPTSQGSINTSSNGFLNASPEAFATLTQLNSGANIRNIPGDPKLVRVPGIQKEVRFASIAGADPAGAINEVTLNLDSGVRIKSTQAGVEVNGRRFTYRQLQRYSESNPLVINTNDGPVELFIALRPGGVGRLDLATGRFGFDGLEPRIVVKSPVVDQTFSQDSDTVNTRRYIESTTALRTPDPGLAAIFQEMLGIGDAEAALLAQFFTIDDAGNIVPKNPTLPGNLYRTNTPAPIIIDQNDELFRQEQQQDPIIVIEPDDEVEVPVDDDPIIVIEPNDEVEVPVDGDIDGHVDCDNLLSPDGEITFRADGSPAQVVGIVDDGTGITYDGDYDEFGEPVIFIDGPSGAGLMGPGHPDYPADANTNTNTDGPNFDDPNFNWDAYYEQLFNS